MPADENISPSVASLKANCLKSKLKIVLERKSTSEDEHLLPSSPDKKTQQRASWSLKRSPLAPRNARTTDNTAKVKVKRDSEQSNQEGDASEERPVSPIIEKMEDPIK